MLLIHVLQIWWSVTHSQLCQFLLVIYSVFLELCVLFWFGGLRFYPLRYERFRYGLEETVLITWILCEGRRIWVMGHWWFWRIYLGFVSWGSKGAYGGTEENGDISCCSVELGNAKRFCGCVSIDFEVMQSGFVWFDYLGSSSSLFMEGFFGGNKENPLYWCSWRIRFCWPFSFPLLWCLYLLRIESCVLCELLTSFYRALNGYMGSGDKGKGFLLCFVVGFTITPFMMIPGSRRFYLIERN